MKKVFSTSAEVAHIWAQQNQSEGRTPYGHCFFEGQFIWSYGHHYCLGAILTNKKGEKIALLNEDKSTNTTNGQRGDVRDAVSHYNRIYTTHKVLELLKAFRNSPIEDYKTPLIRDVATYSIDAMTRAAISAGKRKKAALIESDISSGLYVYDQGVKLLAFYGLKPSKESQKLAVKLQENHREVAALHEKAILQEKKAREKAAKLRAIEGEKKALEALPKWRNGERLDYSESNALNYLPFIALRIVSPDDSEPYVQSSRLASFPVAHALKAFPVIKECKEQAKELDLSGHTIKLGSYTIDKIFVNGDVRAGCHFVKWAEIELIARQLKVFP